MGSEAAPDVSGGDSKPRKKSKHVQGTFADIEQSVDCSAAEVIGTDAPNKKRKKKRMTEAKLTLGIEQSVESSAADVIGTDATSKKRKKKCMSEAKQLDAWLNDDDLSTKPPLKKKIRLAT